MGGRRTYVLAKDPETGELIKDADGRPQLVEVGQDWQSPPSRGGLTSEGEIYNGLVAVDGTPIDSRKKRREYMKATGTTDPSDFRETWDKQRSEREAMRNPDASTTSKHSRAVKEAVERALYEVQRGGGQREQLERARRYERDQGSGQRIVFDYQGRRK